MRRRLAHRECTLQKADFVFQFRDFSNHESLNFESLDDVHVRIVVNLEFVPKCIFWWQVFI